MVKDKDGVIYQITQLVVTNARAEQFYDFMISPDNKRYRKWFPKEHLVFYITKAGAASHLGDQVYYDGYLGNTRMLKFFAEAVVANRPTSAAWQMELM